jgi:quercetin dioxygenase-like cupin family protein
MHLSSINGAPEESVSHNPSAKKQVWFRKGELPPFTQIARVVVPPSDVLAAHAHAGMNALFIILKGTARMVVDGHPHDLKHGDAIARAPGETHELSNPAAEDLVFLVAGWMCLTEKKVLSLPLLENDKQPQRK